jgi:hypothetical protein
VFCLHCIIGRAIFCWGGRIGTGRQRGNSRLEDGMFSEYKIGNGFRIEFSRLVEVIRCIQMGNKVLLLFCWFPFLDAFVVVYLNIFVLLVCPVMFSSH